MATEGLFRIFLFQHFGEFVAGNRLAGMQWGDHGFTMKFQQIEQEADWDRAELALSPRWPGRDRREA